MTKMTLFMYFITLFSIQGFAGEWDKLKNKAGSSADKVKKEYKRVESDINEEAQRVSEVVLDSANVANSQIQDIINKNKPGTDRLLDRTQRNLNRIFVDLKMELEETGDQEKSNSNEVVVVEKEVNLQPLPSYELIEQLVAADETKEILRLYFMKNKFYVYPHPLGSSTTITVHRGAILSISPVNSEALSAANSLLDYINSDSSMFSAMVGTYKLEDGSEISVIQFVSE